MAVTAVAPTAVPLPTDGRAVSVGFVQGNVPQAGLEFNAERRAVLDNHVRGTEALAARAPGDLSLVVWPENSSDIDPFRNPDAAAQIDRAREAVGRAAARRRRPRRARGRELERLAVLLPEQGDPQRYTKLHPVPFAEYIPQPGLLPAVHPDGRPRGQLRRGLRDRRLPGAAPGGDYVALPTICFEVAYDGLMRDSVRAAGDEESLLVVQTNNATFGYTAESEQQFAISRIRAIEHGRSVVHVSTVGVSGFVAPDGTVSGQDRVVHGRAGSRAPRACAPSERPRTGSGAVPEWVAAAALLLLVAREHPGSPER